MPAMRLLLLVLVFASAAHAQSVDARLADLRLATSVRLALVRDAATRSLDVDVTAQDGNVRLSPSPSAALRVAQGVVGVRSVNGAAGTSSATPSPVADVSLAPATPRPSPPSEAAGAETPRASAWGAAPRAEASRIDAPRDDTPAAASGPAVHVVGRGDTLFSLARRYGTTVDVLRRLNGLTGSAGIEIGQRLRLR